MKSSFALTVIVGVSLFLSSRRIRGSFPFPGSVLVARDACLAFDLGNILPRIRQTYLAFYSS
jgi:hypothetical protein